MTFVREHNRRPNVRLDDHRLCNILSTLLKAKADHPAVVRLKELLDQLPSYQAPKYYDRKQSDMRKRADRLGYKIIKDRGENPVTRYVIFYTAGTKRNERYERSCHEAGLEIKEYIYINITIYEQDIEDIVPTAGQCRGIWTLERERIQGMQ